MIYLLKKKEKPDRRLRLPYRMKYELDRKLRRSYRKLRRQKKENCSGSVRYSWSRALRQVINEMCVVFVTSSAAVFAFEH
jgi:hypothetical protein